MYPNTTVKSPVFLHLCEAAQWDVSCADGEHRPESLAEVGFVHLSTPEQVHLPANRLYRGRTDLVLLHVDPDRLTDPVRWETGVPGDPESMRFPHLYGPLPVSAVIAVSAYQPDPDGTFAPLAGPGTGSAR